MAANPSFLNIICIYFFYFKHHLNKPKPNRMNYLFAHRIRAIALALAVLFMGNLAIAQIPSPQNYFGFNPGDDRQLFSYEKLMDYMKIMDVNSPMVHIEQFGATELGRPMYIIFISSAENIANLQSLKEINRQLALDEIPQGTTREELIRKGKVFFLSTLSMHATEVGPAQALPLIAWELIQGNDARRTKILENTVAMFIAHNPDGMNMVVEHYNKYKGTPLETSNMPGVYHKYVGHNINRDFVTLTQSENQMVSEVFSTLWYPQAMVERHQMGSTGPRFYISPPSDPIAENVDAGIWNWSRVFGSRTLTEMTNTGLEGISVNYLFDDYWPGATTTSIWKGVIGMLSEAASVNLASPIFVEPNELRTEGKGLGEYAISINMPKPWGGGWWRLSDIVKYEFENTLSYLNTSAQHRSEILTFRNEVTRREIERGKSQAPYYYIMPKNQHDQGEMAAIVNLLARHGVKIYELKDDVLIQNRLYKAGDVVIPLSQPYRAFIKEVMEVQKFPVRHYTAGGEMIKPYDITTWSLPLHRGVEAVEINIPVGISEKLRLVKLPYTIKNGVTAGARWAFFTSSANESFKAAFFALGRGMAVERTKEPVEINGSTYPAGSFIVPVDNRYIALEQILTIIPVYLEAKPNATFKPVKMPRVGVVESWFHDMDGGWIRYIFDQYHIPYKILRPADLQTTRLQRDFEILFFTDQSKGVFMNGKYELGSQQIPANFPPEFSKGMEKKGFDNLMQFINNGGKVMAWGGAVDLFMGPLSIGEDAAKDDFILPVANIGRELTTAGLYIPGSLLSLKVRNEHPLAWGIQPEIGVFHRGIPVFRTSFPTRDMDRRVIATFTDEKILMSGFAQKEELLKKEAALVWVGKGKGHIILSSFNPQFRASTPVAYKFMFNAMFFE